MTIGNSIKRFAECMESVLQANDHKGGWTGTKCSDRYLREKLFEEISEYMVEGYNPEELIDIANVCMMLFERAVNRNDTDYGVFYEKAQ